MDTAAVDYDLPPEAIAQTPVEPRDAARLLVDQGPGARPGTGTSATWPTLVGPGDVVVVNTTRVLPARLQPHRPTGGAVEVLLLEPATTASRAAGRPSCGRAGKVAAGTRAGRSATTSTVVVEDDLGEGRRVVELLRAGRRRPARACSSATAPCRCRRTSPRPLADPERYQTTYAERAGLGRRADRRPPPHPRAPRRGPGRRGHGRAGGAGGGPGHVPPDRRPTRVEDHHMHGERYAVPEATMAACRSRRRGSWPSAPPRSGPSSRRPPPARSSGRTELFIHGDRPFALVGRPPHQLPPAPVVAARAGRRLRRARAGAPSTTRPSPAATGSSASATPCSCGVSGDDPVDGGHRHRRRRPAAGVIRTARGEIRTPCFMPVGTRGAVRHPLVGRPGRPRRRRSSSATPTT